MGVFRKIKEKKEAESQRKMQQEKDFEILKKTIEEQRVAKPQQEYEEDEEDDDEDDEDSDEE